jgi:hypothetical protein
VIRDVPICVKSIIRSTRRKQRKISNLKNGDMVTEEDDAKCESYSFTPTLSIISPYRKK